MILPAQQFYKVSSHCFLGLLSSLAIFCSTPASAQFSLGIAPEIGYIENPLRVPVPEEDELRTSITVAAQLERRTKLFTSQLNYSINKQEYKRDILNDQTFLDGAGSLIWNIVPELFTWSIANTRSNQLIDIARPDVLDNRQVIDYTSTGPSFTIPLDRASFLSITAQLGVVDFAEFDTLKHRRNSLSASYSRQIDRRLSLSVQSSFTEADYTSAQVLNYDVTSIQGQLLFTSGDVSITSVLGTQSMERSGSRSSSPIRRLDMLYRLNTRLSLSVAYADTVEDLLSDLGSPSAVDQSFVNSDIQLDGNFGSTNAANIYQRRERSIGATYTVPSSYSIGLRYSNNVRQNVDLSTGDGDERLSASFSMPLGNRSTISASVERSRQILAADQFSFERTGFQVGVNYRINNRLSLVFSAADSNQQVDALGGQIEGKIMSLGLAFTR